MTREQCKELLPLMEAFAKGETIEVLVNGQWAVTAQPFFDHPPCNYRIKPKPRELWVLRSARLPNLPNDIRGFDSKERAYAFLLERNIKDVVPVLFIEAPEQ